VFLNSFNNDGLILIKGVFGSVVAVAFQSVFHLKMLLNNVFLFFKNYF
jgi:hypothetical protein